MKKTKKQPDITEKVKRLAPFRLCGAQTLQTYLQDLLAEVDGVRQSEDPECIHRMRVAARRLRSLLPLYTTCFSRRACAPWRKQLRRLARALGAVRDIDVQLACVTALRQRGADEAEQAGLGRLQVRLRQQRQALQAPMLTALERFLASDVSTEMDQALTQLIEAHKPYATERLRRPVYRTMRQAILRRLTGLDKYAPYVEQPEALSELHAMRLAAKRLRYTLQAFAPLYREALAEPIRAARTLQDLLGDLHDCDVWAAQLPPFLEDERARTEAYFGDAAPFTFLVSGIVALQHNRAQFREQRYQTFVAFWQQCQAEGTWEQLRQSLDAPLQKAVAPEVPATETADPAAEAAAEEAPTL